MSDDQWDLLFGTLLCLTGLAFVVWLIVTIYNIGMGQ